ncbi:MAG: peptidase domain-containing ABC transporter [Gammaproteobacteria bacterium]|nr:peptidase domain-containing ABC transporter [Gammaproteobacteria bacterium]
MILQSEAAECGLACMAMVANHFGHRIDLVTLRSKHNVSLKGANMQQLMLLAQQLELTPRALKLELDELGKLSTPCILHWEMNHFVVLKKVHRNAITIFDPAIGERKISFTEVDKAFTGIALELMPTSQFKKVDERVHLSLTSFWSHIQGLVPSLTKLFVLSLVLQFFVLASPYYTQLVVDDVLVSNDKPLLVVLAIGFGLLMVMQVTVQVLRSWIALHLGTHLNMQMVTNLFRHLLHLPVVFFEKRHMGDITSRFGSLASIQRIITSSLIEGILDGIMIILVLVMMLLYSPMLSFVVFTVVALYGLLRWLFYWPMRRLTEESIVTAANENSVFMESIRGIQSLKLFGQQTERLNLWQNKHVESVNKGYSLAKWGIGAGTANQVLFGLEGIVILYLGALLVMEGTMTIGMLFAFMAYKGHFTGRAASLIALVVELKMLKLHLNRLADIALTDKEDEGFSVPEKAINGQLSLRDIRFRYADNEPLLFDGLCIDIPKGSKIAIIGPSGTGKTTLMKIMLGLLLPEHGKVQVDGVDIQHIGLRNYRRQVAAVMQDDQLMSGTLAENISFFDPQVNMDRVYAAAQLAGISHDINAMQMGYNSLVGDMGSALSGGQKQRLLLARALYRRPKILLMDEATSHLDVGLEHHVNQAIQKLSMTQIIIAHRPETILNAQRIYQLHAGKLLDITAKYRGGV